MGIPRWIRVASIVLLCCSVAFANDHDMATVNTFEAEDGRTFLVDSRGKLIYIFLPSGSFAYPLAEAWPEPSRSWVTMWEPLAVGSAGDVDLGSDLDAANFEALEKIRNGERTYHVYWGGEETDAKTFWGLYTFVFDLPLDHYDVANDERPPGWVANVFEAALWQSPPRPINAQRLDDELGGGAGSINAGGP